MSHVPAPDIGLSLAQGVLDSLLEGCQVIGFDGRYLFINEVAAVQGGQSKDRLLGRTMNECFPGIDGTPMYATLQRCMRDRAPQQMENEFALPDGSTSWYELRFVPVEQGVCVFSLDVTRWRQAEARAKESEARLRQLADSMPQIVWTANANGIMDYFNQRWNDYTGMTLAQTQAGGWYSVVHPDDLPLCLERWNHALQTGEPYETRYRFRRWPDGSYRWHLGRALAIRGEPGDVVKWFGTATDIDDQVRTEEALLASQRTLQRSDNRFKRLAESGIIGILVSDYQGYVSDINDSLLAMFGYRRSEMVDGAIRFRDLSPPEWHEQDRRAIEELETTGVGNLREKEYFRKDGTRVPVLVGSAKLDSDTKQVISFILDLTERKQAAAAMAKLREEQAVEASFRALLEAAPDAMVIVGEGDCIVIVNAQTEKLFGYDRSELLGRPIEMLAPARFRIIPHEHRVEFFREHDGSPTGIYELCGRRKDGSEFPLEMSLSPLQSEGRTLASRSIRDITERKQAEERLRQSEERFRLLIDGVRDYAIFMLDTEGRVASWNVGAERVKGYSREEVIGQHCSRFYSADDVKKGEPTRALRIAREEGRFEEEGWRVRKDGTRFMAHVLINAVTDADGRLVGFSKITRDVTERHLAENALKLANRELEAFSYSVAHDLRAPLRAMNGFAQLTLESYQDKLDEEGRDWLFEIVSNAKRMGELIDALLSLSRLNRLELMPQTVDLCALTRGCISRLESEVGHPPVELVCEGDFSVELDPRLARALIENLVGNAWKFTSKVAAPRIELGQTIHEGEKAYFIRDNGAGFDMSYANKLFAPFQRLHTVIEFPGTGIGLATVQRIVHRHGGKVWAEGRVGEGATFFFSFPKAPRPIEREEVDDSTSILRGVS